jgi:hypothetical protein
LQKFTKFFHQLIYGSTPLYKKGKSGKIRESPETRYTMQKSSIAVGPLQVVFHRTVRVNPDEVSNLPPSLGYFDVYKVEDYRQTCPDYWEKDAVFLALHDEEALWLSFSLQRTIPAVAIQIGAGNINAVNGEKLTVNLEKDSYIVHPPQPWLDGWKDKDGTVYQFVTTRYLGGEGKSVGEQLLGSESKTGGLGIAVFEAKDPDKLLPQHTPGEHIGKMYSLSSCGDDLGSYLSSYEAFGAGPKMVRGDVKAAEMGVGKGGKIRQKIYSDPHGLDTWKSEPAATKAIYLVNAAMFSEITGKPMPPIPIQYKDYFGHWFGLHDKDKEDVPGSDKFTGLKTVFSDSKDSPK